MAFSNRYPEIALSHNGENIGFTYKFHDAPDEDDVGEEVSEDWDNEPSAYWFQLRGVKFDVRKIPEAYHETSAYGDDDWIATIRSALDAGVDLTQLPSAHG